MKRIKLTQGKYALVDNEDYDWLSQIKWYARNSKWGYYADHKDRGDKTKIMHREILIKHGLLRNGLEVDHINGNGVDNRKHNLRSCTSSQNKCNKSTYSKKFKYKGIGHVWGRNGILRNKPYKVQITINGKLISGKTCKTIIEAAKEYDRLAKTYHGAFAKLNFPERR